MLALPVALPFAAAVALWLARANPPLRTALACTAAIAQTALAILIFYLVWTGGPMAETLGGWPAPFGVTLVADALSAGLLLVMMATGLAVTVFGLADVTEAQERRGHGALAMALIGGASGALLTGDLFNLYVWFEVTLISAFGLLVLRGGAARLEAALRYAALNLIATIAMLLGVGLLYGATGALNMAELHLALQGRWDEAAVLAPAALLLFAFAAKAGFFPLFFWLPESYHAPSQTATALFAALLTKVAVYALYRVFTLVFDLQATPYLQTLLLWSACLTMVIGVLGAAAQQEVRRILSFHIVSQIGYMALGLAIGSPLAIAAGLFYLIHNIFAKTNLFLTGALAARLCGSEDLRAMGGLWAARPGLGLLFLLSALSMAGIPPLSGFWAKFLIVAESFAQGYYFAGALALAVGLLTLYSMSKIFIEGFLKPHPDAAWSPGPAPAAMVWPALGVLAAILAMGLAVGPFHAVALQAARDLADPAAYVAAVLGPEAAAQ
jgi:multicomponent Na+:H+ antiporter subunit D